MRITTSYMICDRASENRPSRHKLKFSGERKEFFIDFKLYILGDSLTLVAYTNVISASQGAPNTSYSMKRWGM